MTPAEIDGSWYVLLRGERVAGPFQSNSEAWRWIDRQEGQPVSAAEKRAEWVFEQMAKGNGL